MNMKKNIRWWALVIGTLCLLSACVKEEDKPEESTHVDGVDIRAEFLEKATGRYVQLGHEDHSFQINEDGSYVQPTSTEAFKETQTKDRRNLRTYKIECHWLSHGKIEEVRRLEEGQKTFQYKQITMELAEEIPNFVMVLKSTREELQDAELEDVINSRPKAKNAPSQEEMRAKCLEDHGSPTNNFGSIRFLPFKEFDGQYIYQNSHDDRRTMWVQESLNRISLPLEMIYDVLTSETSDPVPFQGPWQVGSDQTGEVIVERQGGWQVGYDLETGEMTIDRTDESTKVICKLKGPFASATLVRETPRVHYVEIEFLQTDLAIGDDSSCGIKETETNSKALTVRLGYFFFISEANENQGTIEILR